MSIGTPSRYSQTAPNNGTSQMIFLSTIFFLTYLTKQLYQLVRRTNYVEKVIKFTIIRWSLVAKFHLFISTTAVQLYIFRSLRNWMDWAIGIFLCSWLLTHTALDEALGRFRKWSVTSLLLFNWSSLFLSVHKRCVSLWSLMCVYSSCPVAGQPHGIADNFWNRRMQYFHISRVVFLVSK